MKILAIDPGFERVGIAVLEKSARGDVLLFSECITTSSQDAFEDRLVEIGGRLKKIIATWEPSVLAIETLLFNSNQKTAMRVAEARGVMLYTSRSLGLSVAEYTPLQIKIAVAGYGRAPKDQVETMVRNLVRIEKGRMYDDEMDAIAIGLTASASLPSGKIR